MQPICGSSTVDTRNYFWLWTQIAASSGSFFAGAYDLRYHEYAFVFGADDEISDLIYQTVDTAIGEKYYLTFYVDNYTPYDSSPTDTPSALYMYINDGETPILQVGGNAPLITLLDIEAVSRQTTTFTTTSSRTTIAFAGWDTPSNFYIKRVQ